MGECSAAGPLSSSMDDDGASTSSSPAAEANAVREVSRDSGGLSQAGYTDAVTPPTTAARSTARIGYLITNSPADDGMYGCV